MMRRILLAVTLLVAGNAAAHAEWHAREEAIMGTRIAVEVWHEDPAAATSAIVGATSSRLAGSTCGPDFSRG